MDQNASKTKEQPQHNDKMQEAVEILPLDKQFYFTGFTNGLGTSGDVMIALTCDNKATALLRTSLIMAKTLVLKLGKVIEDYEEKTGQKIITHDELLKLFAVDRNDQIPTKEKNDEL
jgi:hypothetical protein